MKVLVLLAAAGFGVPLVAPAEVATYRGGSYEPPSRPQLRKVPVPTNEPRPVGSKVAMSRKPLTVPRSIGKERELRRKERRKKIRR